MHRRATRRGLILLGITVGIVVCGLVLASCFSLNALSGVNRSIVTVILAIDLALLAFRASLWSTPSGRVFASRRRAPGRTYRYYDRQTLACVRSRRDSSA